MSLTKGIFLVFLLTVTYAQCSTKTGCRSCASSNCIWCILSNTCIERNVVCSTPQIYMAGIGEETLKCRLNITDTFFCPPGIMKLQTQYSTTQYNMIRPLSTQPVLLLELDNSTIFNNTFEDKFGTYFYSRPSRAKDGDYVGNTDTLRKTISNEKTTVEFTDLRAIGNGNPYAIGFVYQFVLRQNRQNNTFCITNTSGPNIQLLPVEAVIYAEWNTWLGVGLFIGTFIILMLFTLICKFKEKDSKITYYFKFGQNFEAHYGTEALIYTRFNLLLFVTLFVYIFFFLPILLPIDGTGQWSSVVNADIGIYTPGSLGAAKSASGQNNRIYAHVVMAILSCIIMVILSFVMRFCFVIDIVKEDHFTVAITNIDAKQLNELFKDKTVAISEYKDLRNVQKLLTEKKTYDANISSDFAKENPDYKKFMEEQIETTTTQLKTENENIKVLGCFVTFKNTSYVTELFKNKPTELANSSMKIVKDPNDIIWENLGISWTEYFIRIIISNLISLTLLVVTAFCTFISLYAQIVLLFDKTQITGSLKTFFRVDERSTSELESLISLLTLIPVGINLISTFSGFIISKTMLLEKHLSYSIQRTIFIFKYTFYLFFVTALGPFVVIVYTMSNVSVNDITGERFGYESSFFIYNYASMLIIAILISQVFFGKTTQFLLHIVSLIFAFLFEFPVRKIQHGINKFQVFKEWILNTKINRPTIEYSTIMARSLNIFVLSVYLAPVIPLILPFGLFSVFVDTVIDRLIIVLLANKSLKVGIKSTMRVPYIILIYVVICAVTHSLLLEFHVYTGAATDAIFIVIFVIIGITPLVILLVFFTQFLIRKFWPLKEMENTDEHANYEQPYKDILDSAQMTLIDLESKESAVKLKDLD